MSTEHREQLCLAHADAALRWQETGSEQDEAALRKAEDQLAELDILDQRAAAAELAANRHAELARIEAVEEAAEADRARKVEAAHELVKVAKDLDKHLGTKFDELVDRYQAAAQTLRIRPALAANFINYVMAQHFRHEFTNPPHAFRTTLHDTSLRQVHDLLRPIPAAAPDPDAA